MKLLLASVLVLVLVACGSARRGEPVVGQIALSPEAARGEKVFMAECHQCHPKGAAGLGPAINNKPLPGFLMRFQVRHGLGAMPAIGRDKIDEAALDDLVAYLHALREGA